MPGMPLRRKRREEEAKLLPVRRDNSVNVNAMSLEARLEHIWGHGLARVAELVAIPWDQADSTDKLLQVRVFEVLSKRLFSVRDAAREAERAAQLERLAAEWGSEEQPNGAKQPN
jgi:hypothetical protein